MLIQSPHPVQDQALDTGCAIFVKGREEGTTTENDQIGSRHGWWGKRQRLLDRVGGWERALWGVVWQRLRAGAPSSPVIPCSQEALCFLAPALLF